MKAILGATALCLVIAVGTTTAGAQDINIYVYGEDGATLAPGRHGEGHARQMREAMEHRRGDHGMHRRHGHHDMDRASHHGRGHGGKMGHGRRIDRVLDLIELYDQDGDDKVTQAEIDQARADRLSEFDSDGNGMLSLQEYEALWLDAMRERTVDRFQSHDDDGDGQVTVEEFSKRTARLVMRGDRNQDGVIGLDDVRPDRQGHYMMRERSGDQE